MDQGSFQINVTGSDNKGTQIGQQFNHYHTQRPETPPLPSILIPFQRDSDFVERGTLLAKLQERCAKPGSRTAVIGLGGVGKSQLAIEYAYRTRDNSPETWIFWVHGSNITRFEQSYRDIADKAKINGRENPKVNIFKLVRDWLQEEQRRWLLILDNVDDSSFLHDAIADQTSQMGGESWRQLRDYLPRSQNGAILITSRSRDAALELVEARDTIHVGPMSGTDASQLFRKKLGDGDEDGKSQDATELAAALEFMPLAIVQAAAFISRRKPRYSIGQYLEDFRKSDRKKTSLLNHAGGALRRDSEAKNSIIITWQISFEYIQAHIPYAAGLLSLMSFFDREGIPEALLRDQEEEQRLSQDGKDRDKRGDIGIEEGESESSLEDEFENGILVLRDYSFISSGVGRGLFEMHSLVQLATRKWLQAQGQLERWNGRFLKRLADAFPSSNFENWKTCEGLFPHAKSAARSRPQEQDSLKLWAKVLQMAGGYAMSRGNGNDALTMGTEALSVRKQLMSEDDPAVLASMSLVGEVLRFLGRWKDAETLQAQATETRRKILGEEHPSTLTSVGNLAITYHDQGRWKEAEALQLEEMETSKRVLGAEHPDTLTSMCNLASIYYSQGRWKEAEELQVYELETCKRVLGAEHPKTLVSMGNLAATYQEQGRWEKAEKLQFDGMKMSKRVLGEEHPDTLRSIAQLASVYADQGRFKEAEELESKVWETHQRVLGGEHPDTLTTMNNLALTWKQAGQDEKAVKLMEECVMLWERTAGAAHPKTLTSSQTLLGWRAERLKLKGSDP